MSPLEGEGGRGITLDLVTSADVLISADPDDIGGLEDSVVAVMGIGPGSSYITNEFVGRAPRDGNAPGGSYYSNFSVAITLGQDADGDFTTLGDITWQEDATYLAILDSDGDYFDDEIAEAAGLEDE